MQKSTSGRTHPESPSYCDIGFDDGRSTLINLDDDSLKTLKTVKVFSENKGAAVIAMDYSPKGEMLLTAGEDDQIVTYDCHRGIKTGNIYSKKYGVGLIYFAKNRDTAIHSSTKTDDNLRHLSLCDSKYLRYYIGHTDKVTGISWSATEPSFVSASLDNTLRMWDTRSHHCQGVIKFDSKPVAAIDPEGLVLAVGIQDGKINLYDFRVFDKGPFQTFYICDAVDEWTSIQFSPDGSMMMISSDAPVIRLVDAFNGSLMKELSDYVNTKKLHLQTSFSPDSRYIFGGSEDGVVPIWNAKSGDKITDLKGNHSGPVKCVKFNPNMYILTTACSNTTFWIPDEC